MPDLEESIKSNIDSCHKHSPYQSIDQLYGRLSINLHNLVSEIIKKEKVDCVLLQIVAECCYALESLYGYKPFASEEQRQLRAEIELSNIKKVLRDVLEAYQNSTFKKVDQKGRPPKHLVHLSPELVQSIFSCFN